MEFGFWLDRLEIKGLGEFENHTQGLGLVRDVMGLEGQMAANYYGHFLLTALVLDLMPDTSDSRVVSLSSLAHTQGLKRIRFEDINWDQGYDRRLAYSQTKLACLLFALELDRRLRRAGREVLSVAAHPGVSDTELARSLPAPLVNVARWTIGRILTQSAERGALPTLQAALGSDVDGGDYFGPQDQWEMKGDPGPAKIAPWAKEEAAAAKLWDLSEFATGADFPFGISRPR